MKTNFSPDFSIDKENRKITVKREFNASLQKVWAAWTQSEILDKWWAPKPYKSETKSMDFSVGGSWIYAMVAPDGMKHWSRADFKSVKNLESYSAKDAFCDENGNIVSDPPGSFWTNTFTDNGETTTVLIEITFDNTENLEKHLEMGFKEGFTAGMENLDDIFASEK